MEHPKPWRVEPMRYSGKPKIVDADGRMVMRFNDDNAHAHELAERICRQENDD